MTNSRHFENPGCFTRLMRDTGGAAAVEFALVAAPFFFIIACICEQGLIMLADYSLQRGTESAAREIRIGDAPATEVEFREAICKAAILLPDCSTSRLLDIRVRNARSFALLETASLPTTFEPGAGGDAVEVKATYRWRYIFQLPRFYDPDSNVRFYRMTAVSVFRNEPF